jgi:hypothetical protein
MHELSHALGLRHGGADEINYKPNYYSVMNYTWQVPDNIAADASYASSWKLDYSDQALPDLDTAHLDETAGFGGRFSIFVPVGPLPAHLERMGGPVDFNGDGIRGNDSDVAADINNVIAGTTPPPNGILHGFADWSHLRYYFLERSAFGASGNVEEPSARQPELTFEMFQQLSHFAPAARPRPSTAAATTPQTGGSSSEAASLTGID